MENEEAIREVVKQEVKQSLSLWITRLICKTVTFLAVTAFSDDLMHLGHPVCAMITFFIGCLLVM